MRNLSRAQATPALCRQHPVDLPQVPGTVLSEWYFRCTSPLCLLLLTGGHHGCPHSQIGKLRHREVN